MTHKDNIKNFFYITVGALLAAIGLDIFLVPSKIAAGGVSGIATILHYTIHVPVGMSMLVLNILLFILAFLLLGPSFGIKSIYGTIVLSLFVDIFARLFPITYTHDLMLSVIFGDILTGTGLAMIFLQDASTGGTDIIAMLLNKYIGLDIGQGLLLTDFTVTLFAGIFFGWEKGMYSLLAVLVNTNTIDYVVEGIKVSFKVIIISEKWQKIMEYVKSNLQRGVTIIDAEGGYEREKRKMLWIILRRRRELVRLKEFVREIDHNAFLTVTTVKDVFGKGFSRIK